VAEPLRLARVQDAAAWASLSLLLLLAPVGKAYDLLGLTQPRPAGAFVAAGLAVLVVAALLAVRDGGARVVVAAAGVDLVAALLIGVWLLADSPATRTRGDLALGLVAVSLGLQAAFDVAMLAQVRGAQR